MSLATSTIKKFPLIMGIVNVTPDSFSDGGDNYNTQQAVNHCLELLDEGADLIDIGGESTRPGAQPVTEEEEIQRVIPVINELKKLRPRSIISIDTSKYRVAKESLDLGVNIVNDVSGLNNDPRLAYLCAEYNAELVIMHMKGEPRTMQEKPHYNNVILDIYEFLDSKVKLAKSKGVENITVDVGIGFGKSFEHNIKLLKNLAIFNAIGAKQLLGISRKSFMKKAFNIEEAKDRDLHTAFLHALLLSSNLDYIRVHNVSLINQLRELFNLLH